MSLSHSPTGKMGCTTAKRSLVCLSSVASHTTAQIDEFCKLCQAKPEDCAPVQLELTWLIGRCPLKIWSSFRKLSSTSNTRVSLGTSKSLGSLWISTRASRNTVAFSVSEKVELCPNTTNRRTESLGTLSYLENTVSKKILGRT